MPAPPPPRQCPGEQRARPAGPLPLAPTLTRYPVSGRSAGPAGRRERARAGEGAGAARGAAQPRGPSDPGARGSTRLGRARPARSPLTSAAGAGPGARGVSSGGNGGARARPGGGARRAVGGAWAGAQVGAGAQAGAGAGSDPDTDPGARCGAVWGVCASVLTEAPSFINFLFRRRGEFQLQV